MSARSLRNIHLLRHNIFDGRSSGVKQAGNRWNASSIKILRFCFGKLHLCGHRGKEDSIGYTFIYESVQAEFL